MKGRPQQERTGNKELNWEGVCVSAIVPRRYGKGQTQEKGLR